MRVVTYAYEELTSDAISIAGYEHYKARLSHTQSTRPVCRTENAHATAGMKNSFCAISAG